VLRQSKENRILDFRFPEHTLCLRCKLKSSMKLPRWPFCHTKVGSITPENQEARESVHGLPWIDDDVLLRVAVHSNLEHTHVQTHTSLAHSCKHTLFMGLLNICILRTGLVIFSAGSSTDSPTETHPCMIGTYESRVKKQRSNGSSSNTVNL